MGSLVELNDTLQISKEQGFPRELNLKVHLKTPYKLKDFKNKVFKFHHKSKIRNYQQPPVRNFLVENKNGKWVYWGLIQITEITHDYLKQETSGKFKIIYMYTPDEMERVYQLIDRRQKPRR